MHRDRDYSPRWRERHDTEMATVLTEKTHAFEAAAGAGRPGYKVADLQLAEWGRKEILLA